jgi:drug/metabolite transporter (DMT)-like permease
VKSADDVPLNAPRQATASATANSRASSVAVLWLVLSALSFSLMAVCVKGVGQRIPLAEVVLARGVVSLSLSWGLLRRAGLSPWGTRRGLLALRGVLGTVALIFVYAAVTWLPLAAATVMHYIYPIFTALFAWWLLGERVPPKLGLAALVGWLGVLVVARPGLLTAGPLAPGAAALPLVGVLMAITGALLTSLAYVSVRSLGRSEHPLVIVFWFPLVAIPMSLPWMLHHPVLPTPPELLGLLGVGLFTQLGQIGLTQGLTRLPAAQATAIGYVQVAFAALWGRLFFGEALDGWTAAGAALILAATLLSR